MKVSTTDENIIEFEEILFLRIAYEYSKMYKPQRSPAFLDTMDAIVPTFS